MTRFVFLMAFAMTIAGCESTGSGRRSADDSGSAPDDTTTVGPKADWDNTDDGSTDGAITDGSASPDASSDGQDVAADATEDTTDGSTEGCVPPPQYYAGKEYTCVNKNSTQMLIPTSDGWNLGRAPYGDIVNFTGLPCDPTEILALIGCTCED